MNLVVGMIVYQSDLDLLMKNLTMFSRQSLLEKIANFDLRIIIQDNDQGRQLPKIQKRAQEILPKKFFKKLTFLASENVGFGAGHNRIFEYAQQQSFPFHYYLCVNDDGIPARTLLEALLSFAQQTKNKGLYEARQFPVEHAKTYHPETGECDWCSGCCLLIPRKIFTELKGFDELFFLYMEDVDLSWRAKLLNYKTYTVQQAEFFHQNGRSMKNKTKHMYRSAYLLASKFNVPHFKQEVFQELRSLLSISELNNLEKKAQTHFSTQKSFLKEDYMNFEAGFDFSPVRW